MHTKIARKKEENFLVGMYHADSNEYNKRKCLESLTTDGGGLPQVIIATSALGFGINAQQLKYVCHFGAAFSLVDHCQQIGRAGRKDEPNCHAVLYNYPEKLSKIDQSMKDYLLKSETHCLRSTLFTPFNENNKIVEAITPGHSCCSFCTKMCVTVNILSFTKQ